RPQRAACLGRRAARSPTAGVAPPAATTIPSCTSRRARRTPRRRPIPPPAPNPTRTALEECLASLENAAHGHAFSSGIGATTTIMHLVDPGDRVVCVNDVYGGTYRMFSQVYAPKGYEFAFPSPDELTAAIDERTKLVW